MVTLKETFVAPDTTLDATKEALYQELTNNLADQKIKEQSLTVELNTAKTFLQEVVDGKVDAEKIGLFLS